MKTADINGTSASETWPMRWKPPKTTTAVTTAIRPVTTKGLTP